MAKPTNYWTKETDMMIDEFNKSTSVEERNDIYNDYIHIPLTTAIESLICRRGEAGNMDNMRQDLLAFLMTKFNLFDPNRGSGFSYFSTIVANYISRFHVIKQKSKDRYVYLDDTLRDDQTQVDLEDTNNPKPYESMYVEELHSNLQSFIDMVTDQITNHRRKKQFIEVCRSYMSGHDIHSRKQMNTFIVNNTKAADCFYGGSKANVKCVRWLLQAACKFYIINGTFPTKPSDINFRTWLSIDTIRRRYRKQTPEGKRGTYASFNVNKHIVKEITNEINTTHRSNHQETVCNL